MGTPDTNRGIQNAQARYAKRMEGLLVSSQTPSKQKGGRFAANDPRYDEPSARAREEREYMQEVFEKVRKIFEENGTSISREAAADMLTLDATSRKAPDFPYLILALAVIKDVIDFADITGIGVVLTMVTSFAISVILFIWFLEKMNFRGFKSEAINALWRKMVTSKIWTRYVLAIGIEFIPFARMLPATTILIVMSHFSETKVVKLINLAFEELHQKGIRF